MQGNIIIVTLSLATFCAFGQGTFVYDQQTSTDEGLPGYASGAQMQNFIAPWGQSFTPTLSSIDFIRLKLDDGDPTDGLGATLYLTLHSGSINGPTIGTTESVTMPNAFQGNPTFLFAASVPLTPGTPCYFQPVLQSAGPWYIFGGPYQYAGGNEYENGLIYPGGNLWFREGIIVPEPSSTTLLLLAGSAAWLLRRKIG